MTDWWSTSPTGSGGEAERRPERAAGWDPEPLPLPPPAPPVAPKPEPEPQAPPEAKDRKKGILLGAAGAAVVGILVFAAMPDGGSSTPQGSSPTASQEGFLPAAGGGPSEAQKETPSPQETTQEPKPKVVTLTARESGKGRVGVIVDVRIQNDTDDAITLLANFVKGDGRPALVGEGTLAPGSRVIEPGQTAEGTVEFAVGQMPNQVILVDLSGSIVAASGGS